MYNPILSTFFYKGEPVLFFLAGFDIQAVPAFCYRSTCTNSVCSQTNRHLIKQGEMLPCNLADVLFIEFIA